jgi:hypothetical protein
LPDGQGVAELLRGPLLAGHAHVHPRRWQLTLGLDDRGERVTLPRFAAERRGVRRQRGRRVLSGRADLRAARQPRRAE